jgi:hypothetical protein
MDVAVANGLNKVVARDHVTSDPIKDGIQPGPCSILVLHSLDKLQGVGDLPASRCVHFDVLFVFGRDLIWKSVPAQDSKVNLSDILDERHFKMQAGLFYHSEGLSELSDDSLPAFVNQKG